MNERFHGKKAIEKTGSVHSDMRKTNVALGFRMGDKEGQYGENNNLRREENMVTNAARLSNMHLGDSNPEYNTGFS
jgi:hypothetical protein